MSANLDYRENRSVADLLRELRDETSALLQQEVSLARTEIEAKASKMTRNIGYLLIGGSVAYAGLLFLLHAATGFLQTFLFGRGFSAETAVWLGPLIVAVVVGVVGYGLIQKAISTIRSESLVPERTAATVHENTEWAKRKITR